MLNSVWNIRALRTNSGDDERIRNPAPLRHSGEERIVAPLHHSGKSQIAAPPPSFRRKPDIHESCNITPLPFQRKADCRAPRHSGESRNVDSHFKYVSVAFDPAGRTAA